MAWKISPKWHYEPDLAKCREVEVSFTPADDGTTLVELEHRYFSRHGEGFEAVRGQIGSESGWGGLLEMFRRKAEEVDA